MLLLVIQFKIKTFHVVFVQMKYLNCKLYYQQLHLKYTCNLAIYWLKAPWGWHGSVETCRSVIICEIIAHLKYLCNLARCWLEGPWGWHDSVETCRSVIICEIIVHLKYLCNLARYRLQGSWGWHGSVETCRSVIICEMIVHLLVIVRSGERCTVQVLK